MGWKITLFPDYDVFLSLPPTCRRLWIEDQILGFWVSEMRWKIRPFFSYDAFLSLPPTYHRCQVGVWSWDFGYQKLDKKLRFSPIIMFSDIYTLVHKSLYLGWKLLKILIDYHKQRYATSAKFKFNIQLILYTKNINRSKDDLKHNYA